MKELFEKIRHNHMLLMIICCAIPLAIVFVLVYVFKFSNSLLTWAIFLLCPIMHIFMMKDMHGSHGKDKSETKEEKCH